MKKFFHLLKRYRKFIAGVFVIGFLILLSPFIWRKGVQWHYGRFIHPVATVPEKPVAIVFGAAIYGNGRLSAVLQDRMDTAIALYDQGSVQKILVSGDNRFENYDEPGAMIAYALRHGIPEEDIQPDYAGRRTYDTCYRAKEIFEVDAAILVTQEFHLPRALFLCQNLGIESVGVASDLHPYVLSRWFAIREVAATSAALLDIIQKEPAPILGEKIPILTQ